MSLNPSDHCVKHFSIFSQFQALAEKKIVERPKLKTPAGEFRLMPNGDVDFNGKNISKYGLEPTKEWHADGWRWRDRVAT